MIVHWLVLLLVVVVVVGLVAWLARALRRPTSRRLDRIDERLSAIERALGTPSTDEATLGSDAHNGQRRRRR